MRLRKYLVKRVIHMVITLMIVLILLFVLFRLMPGSAAQSLFMKPGIGEVEKKQIAVKYGFAKWVDLPGNNFINTYTIEEIGEYSIVIRTGDGTVSDEIALTFDVNVDPAQWDIIPPVIADISYNYTGNDMMFTAAVFDDHGVSTVNMGVQENYLSDAREDVGFSELNSGIYSGTLTDVVTGHYNLTLEITDDYENEATATYIFDVTVDSTDTITSVTPILEISTPATDSYPTVHTTGEAVSIAIKAEGATSVPDYRVVRPDGTPDTGTMDYMATGLYQLNYTPSVNGNHILEIIVDNNIVRSSFPVNSPAMTAPTAPEDDGQEPILSNFLIVSSEELETNTTEYPILLREGATVYISVDIADADGERWEGSVMGNITLPGGNYDSIILEHPRDVEDRSMLEQFYIYMTNMLVFDFGESFEDSRPVWDVIIERVPPTLLLFGTSLILSYAIGILVGVIVAWRRGSVLELSTIVVTLFFYSMPIFWSALIAQWIFYSQLGWFPLSGFGGTNELGEKIEGVGYVLNVLWHLALPLITLTVLHLAGTILLMRSSMLEVMGEDFIMTAKAKGLKQRTVVYKHAARNAMLPVVTSMALSIGGIISGGVLTETIFSWPGMGTLLVRGTLMHNYPVVQGAFYIMAGMTILGNMLADILYAYLDPRVQL